MIYNPHALDTDLSALDTSAHEVRIPAMVDGSTAGLPNESELLREFEPMPPPPPPPLGRVTIPAQPRWNGSLVM